MKGFVQFILLLAFAGLGIFFGHLNPEKVHIDFFFFQTDLPLAISHMLFFIAGLLISATIVYFGTWWRLRKRWRAQMKTQAEYFKAEKKQQQQVLAHNTSTTMDDNQ